MAYNVLKRPMFKRGGSTTGTGIMSHVESKKIGGGTISGNNMPNNRTGFQNPLFGLISEGMANELSRGAYKSPGQYNIDAGARARQNLLSNLQRYGKKGLEFLRGAGQRSAGFFGLNRIPVPPGVASAATSTATMAAPFAPVGIMAYLNRPKTDVALDVMRSEPASTFDETSLFEYEDYARRMKEAEKQGKEIGFLDIFKSSKDKDKQAAAAAVEKTGDEDDFEVSGLPARVKPGETAIDAVFNRATESKKPKYEETDLRTRVQKEADEIMNLIKDEDLDKAEAALLVSKALKTSGSISDKIDAAVTDARSIAKRKASESKAAKLMAYKTIKEEDIAKIKSGELPGISKVIKRLSDLKASDPKTLSGAEKQELASLEDYLKKETYGEKQILSYMSSVLAANRDKIPALERKINDLKSEGSLDEDEKADLARAEKELETLKYYENVLGVGTTAGVNLAEGGRVKYADGTEDPNAPEIESDEMAGGSNVFPTKTVEKLTFAELRQKLPQEITNDIVQLIANSEEALQDFAYIATQKDINDFNIKYGVNLVLPPQKG